MKYFFLQIPQCQSNRIPQRDKNLKQMALMSQNTDPLKFPDLMLIVLYTIIFLTAAEIKNILS
jgi:hypothetical protein